MIESAHLPIKKLIVIRLNSVVLQEKLISKLQKLETIWLIETIAQTNQGVVVDNNKLYTKLNFHWYSS